MGKKSQIFAHLVNNETCKALSTENCFDIIDSASTIYLLNHKSWSHKTWSVDKYNKDNNFQ